MPSEPRGAPASWGWPGRTAAALMCALSAVTAGCGQRDVPAEPERQSAAELAARARELGFTRDIPKALVRACDEVKPSDAAICPPRWVPQGITTADGFDFDDEGAEAFAVDVQSPDRVPYHQLGHWMFGSARASDAPVLKRALFLETASSKRTTRIAGVSATLWLIPTQKYGGQGMLRGHAVVTWNQGGRFHWTSFHDQRNTPRARLLAETLITDARQELNSR